MDIVITKGSHKYIRDCEEALTESELGKRYFANKGSAKKAIEEGLVCENLYIALYGEACIGFIYYIPNGAFHAFTYLHIISVKEAYRGMGVGEKMMDFLECILLEKSSKIFLVVGDYNPDAKRFYERLGFCQVGELPNLYRQGITEYLMMKEANCFLAAVGETP